MNLALYASQLNAALHRRIAESDYALVMCDRFIPELRTGGNLTLLTEAGGGCPIGDLYVQGNLNCRDGLVCTSLYAKGSVRVDGHLTVTQPLRCENLRVEKPLSTRGDVEVTGDMFLRDVWYYDHPTMCTPKIPDEAVHGWVLPYSEHRPYWVARFRLLGLSGIRVNTGCYSDIVARIQNYGVWALLGHKEWTDYERFFIQSLIFEGPQYMTGKD